LTAGRLSRVTDAAGSPYAAYTYAPDGNLAMHIVGDSVVTGSHSYTPRDWPSRLRIADVGMGNESQPVFVSLPAT